MDNNQNASIKLGNVNQTTDAIMNQMTINQVVQLLNKVEDKLCDRVQAILEKGH